MSVARAHVGTARLYSPNSKNELLLRMAIRFNKWIATVDGKAVLEGNWPTTSQGHDPTPEVAQMNAQPLNFSLTQQ